MNSPSVFVKSAESGIVHEFVVFDLDVHGTFPGADSHYPEEFVLAKPCSIAAASVEAPSGNIQTAVPGIAGEPSGCRFAVENSFPDSDLPKYRNHCEFRENQILL